MQAYRINPNGTPGDAIELPDDTTIIAADLTFNAPPAAADGQFVVFDHAARAWSLTESEPEPSAPPVAPSRVLTVLAFRQRFSMAEKAAIEIASLDNPIAPIPERAAAAGLRAYLGDVAASQFIDLTRPDTRAGVEQIEAMGLIAEGRAGEILDAPVQLAEAPA